MNDAPPEPISFDQIRRVLSRRRWVLIQLVVMGAVAGILFALAVPRTEAATATVLVSPGAGSDASAPVGLSADVAARLIRTRAVAKRVSEELGDQRPLGELLGAVSVQRDESGAFIDITARDDSARAAAQLANAFAEQFIAARSERSRDRARRAIASLERQLADLPRRSRERSLLASELAELRTTALLGDFDAELIERAVTGATQAEAAPLRWGAAGAALGLLLGLVLAFSLEALDPRVRRLSELRRLVDAPQLAALPRLRRPRGRKPRVLAASREPFDQLRTALLVLNGGADALRRILVTSPTDRTDGNASVAAHLAVSLARQGFRVAVVDTDLRHPALGAQFGLDDAAPGLADAIRRTPAEQVVHSFDVPSEQSVNGSRPRQPVQISVVTAGSASGDEAGELLSGGRVEGVLDDLAADHDIVIVQCAPLLAVGDALALLAQASGAILVVQHSRTQRRDVARAAQVIREAGGSLLGTVVTGVPKGELAAEGYGPWPSAAARPAVVE